MSILMKIISWTIPFALGLASTFIVDGIRKYNKRKKDKEFVIDYLENSILKILPKLKDTYNFVIKNIDSLGLGKHTTEAFEDFNTNVLRGITYTDYYLMFTRKNKKDFIQLVEIIAMIDFLRQQLPSKINNDYFANINRHLIETNNRGNESHIQECEYCNAEKESVIALITATIYAVDELQKKIEQVIKSNSFRYK